VFSSRRVMSCESRLARRSRLGANRRFISTFDTHGVRPALSFPLAWIPMNDKDHVFARFKDDTAASAERHERLTMPGRGAGSSSRSVEVVHVRTRAASAPPDRTRQMDRQVRAASWDDGFPATPAIPPTSVDPDQVKAPKPVTHLMPAWEPAEAKPEVVTSTRTQAAAAVPPPVVAAKRRKTNKPARRVADPFDAADDGANCLRCGYVVEPVREKRGLRTCTGCA
jgi:hypothetical protein